MTTEFKMVPVEPTEEMIEAASYEYGSDADVYRAMLAAAPVSPQPIYAEEKERELFEAEMTVDSEEAGFGEPDLHREADGTYRQAHYQSAWGGWIRCAQLRAKAGEVGHE